MNNYRTLHVWQRGRELALAVLRATDAPAHPRCRVLFDQLRRAAVSVEANVVEGYALGSARQFHRHLRIALGSAAESECLIELISEMGYLPADVVNDLCGKVTASLATLQGILRRHKPRG